MTALRHVAANSTAAPSAAAEAAEAAAERARAGQRAALSALAVMVEENGCLAGHGNRKQKIRHLVDLKREMAGLRVERELLTVELRRARDMLARHARAASAAEAASESAPAAHADINVGTAASSLGAYSASCYGEQFIVAPIPNLPNFRV